MRRHPKSLRDVEPANELVKAQGGVLGSFRRAGASLGNGVVTRHARRLARFGLVGLSGVVINTTLLYVLAEAGGLNHLVAAVFATEAAILNNFLLNDRWTFGDAESGASRFRRALRYNSVALVGLVISVAVLAVLTYLLDLHYLVANLFAIGAGMLWNYAGSFCFTWAAVDAGAPFASVLAVPLRWGRRFVVLVVTGVNKLWE